LKGKLLKTSPKDLLTLLEEKAGEKRKTFHLKKTIPKKKSPTQKIL